MEAVGTSFSSLIVTFVRMHLPRFVNFSEAESCNQAVELMNNFTIDGFTLRVSQSLVNSIRHVLAEDTDRRLDVLVTNEWQSQSDE